MAPAGYFEEVETMQEYSSESLNEAFQKWVGSMVNVTNKTIAIDGKTIVSTEIVY